MRTARVLQCGCVAWPGAREVSAVVVVVAAGVHVRACGAPARGIRNRIRTTTRMTYDEWARLGTAERGRAPLENGECGRRDASRRWWFR